MILKRPIEKYITSHGMIRNRPIGGLKNVRWDVLWPSHGINQVHHMERFCIITWDVSDSPHGTLTDRPMEQVTIITWDELYSSHKVNYIRHMRRITFVTRDVMSTSHGTFLYRYIYWQTFIPIGYIYWIYLLDISVGYEKIMIRLMYKLQNKIWIIIKLIIKM